MTGLVYLVGAGPGDPKLITVKGLECIKKADCVVYDRLATPKLLSYAKPDAELIYVGKAPDRHVLNQEEINRVLVEKALLGKTVTRLKGGDPFVFGRGGEEIEVLLEHNISYEVIPGVTAGIAAPAYAGIPVTHRNCNTSVAFITGNEDPTKDYSSIDWAKLAMGIGTKVFYMGMRNLPHICEKLIENDLPETTPVAVIRWGTRPEQKTVIGTLGTIVDEVQRVNLKNPAVIVIGDVVNLRSKMQWIEKKPLFGKRIVITRARNQASVLTEAIENLGGEPWEFPLIAIEEPEDFAYLDQAITNVRSYDWLILTSVNGVEAFFRRLRHLGKDVRELYGINLCAVGPKTREALEVRGLTCEYVPGEYKAEGIIEIFKDLEISGKRFLLPRADIGRKVLPEALEQMGAHVDDVAAYRNVICTDNADQLKQMLVDQSIQLITFTSSSTVNNLLSILEGVNYHELLNDVVLASIGPITSETIRKHGLTVGVEAKEYTIDGLVEAIKGYFQNK